MNRTYYYFAGACLTVLLSQPAAAVDVQLHIGVPGPPRIVFEHEPNVVVVPHSEVYYVPDTADYDMYRYGRYWYVNRDGYWYRARRYDGPFRVVEYRVVPRAIIGLPVEYRRYPLSPHRPHAPHRPHQPRGHGWRHGDRHHDRD